MLKRIFVCILIAAIFFVAVQFASVFFYAFAFDDFVKDEVKFAPVREQDTKAHLVEHIAEQAKYYGQTLDPHDIQIDRHTDLDSGITTLSVDVDYIAPVDLYYFTARVHRHLHAATSY
jgi:hypothetical protein